MKTTLLLFVSLLFFSCHNKAEKEEPVEEIIAIHRNLIKAHLEKNPEFLVNILSDNFISVKEGDILYPGRDVLQAELADYINNTTFTEYKDLQEPVIGFSEDGKTAWAIVKVQVKGTRMLEKDSFKEIDFTCAWLTLYRKVKNDWVVDVEVSTFK